MTENTTETRTVQNYRHAARRVLTQARESLALRTDATHEVYRLLNGSIEKILAGRPGLTQEQQVEFLENAKAKVAENREALAEAVERAKQEVIAQVEAWDFDTALVEALSTLDEAREFAATRDFDAWQAQKRRTRYGFDDEADDSTAEEDAADE